MSTEATTLLLPTVAGITPVDPDHRPDERKEQERREAADCPELLTYLKRTCDAIKEQRTADWDRILASQARCVAYYDDRQYGTVKDGVFVDAKREPGDIRPVDNQYKIQVDKLLMEFSRAFPEIAVNAADRNDTRMVEAAKFAQARVNANRKALLKHSHRLCEGQALLLKTMTWRYVYFNRQADDSPMERRPRKATKSYGRTRSLRACKLCGGPMKMQPTNGQANDTYKCINCGSNREKVVEVSAQQQDVVEGYDEIRGGRVDSRHIDPTQVRISLSARRAVADSTFLWYHQQVQRCILEAAYPEMKIKSGAGTLNQADSYKRDAESVPSNTQESAQGRDETENAQGGTQFEECPFDLFWIDSVVYQRAKFTNPQKLLGGRTLPANAPLIEMFPDGMCVAMNADQVMDVYGENKNPKWMFCVYGIREHALHGAGTNNLLGPQDTRNDLKSYLIANVYYNCGRREFIREGAFVGNRLPALNEAAVVSQVPDDKPIRGWAHASAEGSPLPAQAVELYGMEAGSMQEGAGTSSLDATGASPDVRKAMGTATGVIAMRDMQTGRMGPNLMLFTEMEEEWSYVVLELELENFSEERFMHMANQSVTAEDTDGSITYSAEGIKAFRECNPRVDLEIKAVQGSWMPRTEAERQAKFAAFVQVAKEIVESLGDTPRAHELIAIAADTYGVSDIEIGGWTSTEHVAAARIRAFAVKVETFEKRGLKQPTPELIQQIISATPECMIDYEMDNHPLFIAFYDQWWASDEGQSCSPLLRAVIKAQRIIHRKGVVYKAQALAQDQLAGEAPKVVAAQETTREAMDDQPPKESLSYKDAPPAIRRQMEAAAGYEPATDDGDDGTAAEAAKTQGTLAVQEHKGELEADQAKLEAQLKMAEVEHEAEVKEAQAQSEHQRQMQSLREQQEHETGIKGAEIMQKSVEGVSERQHKKELSESERQAERERMAAEQKAKAAKDKK